jgi:hypothetical protein
MASTDRTLTIDAVVKRSEAIGASVRSDIIYRLYSERGFNEEDTTQWKVGSSVDNTQLNFPPGITTATGMIIRISKPVDADDYIQVRLNAVDAPLMNVEEVVVWFGCSITSIYVTNPTDEPVDVLFHFFSE